MDLCSLSEHHLVLMMLGFCSAMQKKIIAGRCGSMTALRWAAAFLKDVQRKVEKI